MQQVDRDDSIDEIEAAYQRAMMVVDATETLFPAELGDETEPAEESGVPDDVPSESASPTTVETDDGAPPVLDPREVVEAALFVGGQPLTTKRIGQMLGGDQPTERIDAFVERLNAIYQQERRPYQIDFGEGGYRLVLLPEYEPVRNAVFGAGPNEVKLSQDALEVLAFVAYRQPVSVEELEEAGKQKPMTVVRQLLRRGLLMLNRAENGDVTYSTTPRFLEVFGLRSLDDLPFPEDFELK